MHEESESEVDDSGLDDINDLENIATCVLRPKIDQVTRWNSVYAMGVRLIALRVPVELWYVN